MSKSGTPPERIEILAAKREDEPVLANLLELYVYEFSELLDMAVGEDGRFGYPRLSLYWSEADRYPLLVRVDGKLGGFALVRRGPGVTCDGRSGMWQSFLFCARIAGEVWGRGSRTRCGAGSRGNGKFG